MAACDDDDSTTIIGLYYLICQCSVCRLRIADGFTRILSYKVLSFITTREITRVFFYLEHAVIVCTTNSSVRGFCRVAFLLCNRLRKPSSQNTTITPKSFKKSLITQVSKNTTIQIIQTQINCSPSPLKYSPTNTVLLKKYKI